MGTRDIEEARERAFEWYGDVTYKKQNNIPLVTRRFEQVLDEYLAMRQRQYERGNYVKGRRQTGEQTSAYNLRQMKRIGRFLSEFHGKTPIDRIDDAKLKDYVPLDCQQ